MEFRGETSRGVAKCRLFSQATFSLDLRDFNFLQLCDFEVAICMLRRSACLFIALL